jgi:hypothetical protein
MVYRCNGAMHDLNDDPATVQAWRTMSGAGSARDGAVNVPNGTKIVQSPFTRRALNRDLPAKAVAY